MDSTDYEFHLQILRLAKGMTKAYEQWIEGKRSGSLGAANRDLHSSTGLAHRTSPATREKQNG